MARPSWFTNTFPVDTGRNFTYIPSESGTRVRGSSHPSPARVFVIALLLCLGVAGGWAQPGDPQPQQKGQQPQQKGPPPEQKKQQAQQDGQQPQQKDQQRQQNDREQMRGLDEQIQEIKSDVLRITAELSQLEEKLLYPSGTQVAIFVALAKGDTMRLDAVRLKIDGQLAAHYIYSFKELEALRKGGVQRLYVGNVSTGEHQLEVLVDGKLEGGTDFSHSEHFAFRKEVKPKLVGLTLSGSGGTPISLGEW